MKAIGLLGGMSWESTVSYYRSINEDVKQRLGGLHSAKIAMVSVDFDAVEKLQRAGDWSGAGEHLAGAARQVQAAGADCLLICTNTMHKVAPAVEAAIDIPLLHIADATAGVLLARSVSRVGLLGTAFTMEQDFYTGRLSDRHGLDVLVPNDADREVVHRVIYDELCMGVINRASRDEFLRVMDNMARDGAQGIILGCTEIGLLLSQADTSLPLFDTTTIHARHAVEWALAD